MVTSMSLLSALLLSFIALAHSLLGERYLLGPLLAQPLPPPLARFHGRTLRMAWHLTSLAWWGLAWALVWPDSLVTAVAVVLGLSAVIGFVGTRGAHFVWPLFVVSAYAAASAGHGAWLRPVAEGRQVLALGLTVIFAALAALHVYWAVGGRRGLAQAIPSVGGAPAFVPPPALTAVVALGLAALAALPWLVEVVPGARLAAGAAAVVFAARVVGDLRTAGVFKRVRGTAFARADDLVYTPLCFALGAGLGALAVG